MDVRRNIRRRRKERMARIAAADADRPAGEEAGEHAGPIGEAGGAANEDKATDRAGVKADHGAITLADITADDGTKSGVHAAGGGHRHPAPSSPSSARNPIGVRLAGGPAARSEAPASGEGPVFEGAKPPARFPDPAFSDDPETWWKERMKRRETESGSPADGGSLRFFRGLAVRAVWALMLFGALWGWLRFELPGAPLVRFWLSDALAEEMNAQAVRAWYERHFAGSPAFLQQFGNAGEEKAQTIWSHVETSPPVDGRLIQTFAENGAGVRFAAPATSPVRAVYAGLVMQVAGSENGASTVLIRHPNRIVTVYGNVARPAVRPGDWVETGQTIGRLGPTGGRSPEAYLDFAVRQNGKPLDPAAVIPLD